jgi:hypothetical protein
MTNFNPKNQEKSNDEWAELALQKSGNSNTQFHVIGGLFGAVFVAGATSPITGLILGAWVLYSAWNKSGEGARNKEQIISSRCIANVLEGDDFTVYASQFGDDAVEAQLHYAEKMNLGMSEAAADFLDDLEEKKRFGTPKALPSANNSQIASKSKLDTESPSKDYSTEVSVYNPADDSRIDLIGEMTNKISNIFVVGLGGSGKGMLIANALRSVKEKHPNKKIFLINGKNDPKEAGYFEGIVDKEEKMDCESAKPSSVAAWFDSAIKKYDDFAASNNGALLVIDEGTIIGARLKTAKSTALTDKLIGITSCGGSTGKNIWFIAQTPYVGANGSDLSGISQLTPIVLVTSQNLSILDSWKRSAVIKKFEASEVSEMVDNSEVNRAVYFGKTAQWYSMPKLINHSAFNRDTGEIIASNQKTKIIDKTSASEDIHQPTVIQEDSDTSQIIDKLFASLKYSEKDELDDAIKEMLPEAKENQIKHLVNIVRDKAVLRGDTELLVKFNIIKKDA